MSIHSIVFTSEFFFALISVFIIAGFIGKLLKLDRINKYRNEKQ
jgi:hypothetical protein